jgi:hypothetical protein
MSFRRVIAIAALSAGCLIGSLGPLSPASAEQTVDCWVNGKKQTCTITPWGKNGMEIVFSGGALFRFAPAGPATTDKRRMRDEQGRIWLMSGNRSFELVEQGGFGNKIAVSSERAHPAAAAGVSGHSKVKLTGRGKPTVPLYAEPRLGAEVAGMGVSGETLNRLACTTNSQGTWCRVSYPGQSGRVLWVPRESLIFLGDGE